MYQTGRKGPTDRSSNDFEGSGMSVTSVAALRLCAAFAALSFMPAAGKDVDGPCADCNPTLTDQTKLDTVWNPALWCPHNPESPPNHSVPNRTGLEGPTDRSSKYFEGTGHASVRHEMSVRVHD